ncbi:MAG: hypothetical protein K9K37_05020 [Desulfocapsa sp.]|nr:hypothetical protein [Desulfocapsa sp.]
MLQVRFSSRRKAIVGTVAYRIAVAFVGERYCQVITPASHALWRVDFYKCADDTSYLHWLTCSPVDLPYPNFHHPQSFGLLHFE